MSCCIMTISAEDGRNKKKRQIFDRRRGYTESQTPTGERVHIGIFGRCNAGKSSVLNAVTGQSLAVVSPVEGTTTDPVYKAMELLPLGPVLFMDTPGLDDRSLLGALRTERAGEILRKNRDCPSGAGSDCGGEPKGRNLASAGSSAKKDFMSPDLNKSDLIRKEAAEGAIRAEKEGFQKKTGACGEWTAGGNRNERWFR